MKKPNRYERRAEQDKKIKAALHGEGLYEYQNNRKGELSLPKPAKNGIRKVAPGKTFEGDNYFMQMVKTNDLRLVKEIISPSQERKNMQEKLLLDQPDIITNEGKIEHVVQTKKPQKMNEQAPQTQPKAPEVLINEDPIEGFEIING